MIYGHSEVSLVTRGFGEVAALHAVLPDWTALVLAVLTQLGDVWFLLLLLVLLYWSQQKLRADILLVAGTYVTGLGSYKFLKHVFAFPRPNEVLLDPTHVPALVRPLYESTAFASSFGFPSGHATSATIVYVGLATILPIGTTRQRYGVAASVVAVVSVTRIALGLHFLVDILAGVALGCLLVATATRARAAIEDYPTVALLSAVFTTGLFAVVSGGTTESLLAAGLAGGLFGGWELLEITGRKPVQSAHSPAIRVGVAAVALGLLVVALVLVPVLRWPVAAAGLAGIGAAAAVTAPQFTATYIGD